MSGNCGVSYFYLYDDAGRQFHIRTGFDLTSRAVNSTWRTVTRGEDSTSVDSWEWGDDGPIWPNDVWTSGSRYSTQDTRSGTHYYGRVTTGIAYMLDGGVCTTGYPDAGRNLYC